MERPIANLKIENLFNIRDKVVLISGIGGLGADLVEGFAANGATLALANRSQAHMDQAAAKAAAYGVECRTYLVDIADKQQVESMVAQVERDFGRIDVLLHTVGIAPLGPSLDLKDEDLRKTIEVNFYGTVYINAAVGKIMAKNHWGRIINISSIDAYTVNCVDDLPYSASKSAMAASTRHFAVDLAKQGVTVNNIAPVWIWTPMMDQRPTDYMVQAAATIPMGRCSYGQDYLGMCIYLASDASAYVTGQTFLVDGGWSVYRAFTYAED